MLDMLVIHQHVPMLSPMARAASPEDKTKILVITNNAIKMMQA